ATAERYRQYRSGRRALGPEEREQLGFRVAARLGHKTVYPIDVADTFYDPAIEPAANAEPRYRALLDALAVEGERLTRQYQRWLADGTIGEALRHMNTPEALREALAPYIRFLAPVTAAVDYPGADMVGAWYRRNLRIFARLWELAGPGERLLVIYGHGHAPVLGHLLELSDRFEPVDPGSWLGA
ncbi:MAG: DUF5694 domain-containing protein, partial [Acidimicrobiales bacterium]